MIFIDYNDKRPIYEQVTEKIQTLILNGVLESDSKLPSVRSLAMELSINPNTIQRAYSELEREGFIYSVKGRGNFVKMNENLIIKEQEKLGDFLHLKRTLMAQYPMKAALIQRQWEQWRKNLTFHVTTGCVIRQSYDVSRGDGQGE